MTVSGAGVRLVGWEVQIPADEQDGELGDRLRLAAGAVLRHLAFGYADWRDQGLGDPEQVTKATDAWRGESDALGRFIDRPVPDRPELLRPLRLTCSPPGASGARPSARSTAPQTAFSLELTRLGYSSRKSSGIIWDGIALTGEDEQGGLGGLGGSTAYTPTRVGGEPLDPPNPPKATVPDEPQPGDPDWELPF